MSLPRLVHVARKLTPGEPPAEDILAVNAYSAMLKQKATCAYEERFHASKLNFLRGPEHMFQSFAANHPPSCVHIGFGSSPPARRYWQNEGEGLGGASKVKKLE